MEWSLRPATAEDQGWIAELRALVLRADLERLGRYDPVRVRERFRSGFVPRTTTVVVVDGRDVGSVAVRPAEDGCWIEHFYLAPEVQGRGIGSEVLGLLIEMHAGDAPLRLDVLQGSAARRLYERHGFVVHDEDPIDVLMVRA